MLQPALGAGERHPHATRVGGTAGVAADHADPQAQEARGGKDEQCEQEFGAQGLSDRDQQYEVCGDD